MNERPKRIDRRWAYKIDPGMRLTEEICERESPSVKELPVRTTGTVALKLKVKEPVWH